MMRRTFAALTGTAMAAAVGAGLMTAPEPKRHAVSSDECLVSGITPDGDRPQSAWSTPAGNTCKPRTVTVGGQTYALPDPKCTPGAVNPTVTLDVLRNPTFRTGPCVRDKATGAATKDRTYGWYGITKPANNVGKNQVCEKDHLISLELGGADTLDNIWPQCGPDQTTLDNRYFKQKDLVENYLAAEVKAGDIPLDEAQRDIASDWTQLIAPATQWYNERGAIHNDDAGS